MDVRTLLRPREFEVLQLIGQGLKTSEIGERRVPGFGEPSRSRATRRPSGCACCVIGHFAGRFGPSTPVGRLHGRPTLREIAVRGEAISCKPRRGN
jgi:hypothetical protein